jgi:uncharacterized protein (TIGR03437 family)
MTVRRHLRSRISIASMFWLAMMPLNGQEILGGEAPTIAAVDARGFIYVGGSANGSLPTTAGALHPFRSSECYPVGRICSHSFIAKLNPTGDNIEWATYWAGNGTDILTAIAVAPDGTITVAGTTNSTNLLPDTGGYRSSPGNLFVAKLSADGKSIVAATYFGARTSSPGPDKIAAIRFDSFGNVVVAGDTFSSDFPTTPGAFQTAFGAGPTTRSAPQCSDIRCSDQFVAKFSPSLSLLHFCTLFGAAVRETASDLTIGRDGTLYLTGVREMGFQKEPSNAIVTRFSPDASSLLYSAEVPNGRSLVGNTIVVDAVGGVYVAASTQQWYTSLEPRGVVAKLDSGGAPVWSREIPVYRIDSATLNEQGEFVITGLAGQELAITKDAPHFCHSHPVATYPAAAFLSRFEPSGGANVYSGFLIGDTSWILGPNKVLAHIRWLSTQRFAVLPTGIPPPGTITCVANTAYYDSNVIAPGDILSIFGTDIGSREPVFGSTASDGKLTTEIGGVSVTLGGRSMPVLYADPGQINVVAPFGLPYFTTLEIAVRRNGIVVAKEKKTTYDVHRALFTTDSSARGPVAALNEDGTWNTRSNPAPLGSVITVFGSGFGEMSPPMADGETTCSPVSRPKDRGSIEVGGVPASTEYFGNAPCQVAGLVQINIRLPLSMAIYQGTAWISVNSALLGSIAVR